jgi:hypothetical protein
MPSETLVRDDAQAMEAHEQAVRFLVPLVLRMALDSIADVVPGTHVLETYGEFDEDWIRTLRIQRVLDADGGVLVSVEDGHDDADVEDMLDTVNVEYLDLLLHLTGSTFMGAKTIDRTTAR